MQFWMTYLLALLAYQQWRLFRYRVRLQQGEELFRIVAESAPT